MYDNLIYGQNDCLNDFLKNHDEFANIDIRKRSIN